uniref:Uncharacterized protein n=1 Tax=Arundo donax TaxID=35708 RepID=A0A0A8ZKJ0_ARUDO
MGKKSPTSGGMVTLWSTLGQLLLAASASARETVRFA